SRHPAPTLRSGVPSLRPPEVAKIKIKIKSQSNSQSNSNSYSYSGTVQF
ncbi:hypothetical protein IAE39_002141, partial [Pseudomonas sp. S37]|nr:hypothetical protein [Pseudomonas sp. S37]